LGSYSKKEIRQIAEDHGLLNVANKPDSYEICFVPDDDYRRFLKDRVQGLEDRVKGGNFVDKQGNILGQHEGYPFYTIGQRRGLNIPMGKPVYVTHIDPKTNTITIGEKEDLMESTLIAKELNFIKYDKVPNGEMEITGAIRYNDSGAYGIMTQLGEDEMKVHFPAGREAITPGQAIVCYEGDDVVAGGWIKKVNVPLQQEMDSLV
jgi:tRNA-specific 2-thiouridylase